MGEPIAQADNITETITAMGGASAVRAAIDASQDSIAVEDMTGTGWTTLAGSGTHTETWDGSELAMTVDVSGAGSGAVRHTTLLPSPLSWSLAARVAIVTGNGGSQRQAYIAAGVDATNNVALALFGDGTLIASSTVGGSYGAHATVSTTVPSGDRTGGQLWLLIEKYGGTLTYAWGIGSAGARPTAWTIIHINTTTTVQADCMQRAPVFVFDSAREARSFLDWIDENMAAIREAADPIKSCKYIQFSL
jgi:hypothetical protein